MRDDETRTQLIEENDRRLEAALSLWPSVRHVPEAQRYYLLTSLLVSDDAIFARIQKRASPKRRGAPKKRADELTRSLDQCAEIAAMFAEFFKQEREKSKRAGCSQPSQEKIRKAFRAAAEKRFRALPESDEALARLIRRGRKALKYPRCRVKGRLCILHPRQAEALDALARFPLEGAQQDRAVTEILELRPDDPSDLERLKSLTSMYILRAHAIGQIFGINPFPPAFGLTRETSDK